MGKKLNNETLEILADSDAMNAIAEAQKDIERGDLIDFSDDTTPEKG